MEKMKTRSIGFGYETEYVYCQKKIERCDFIVYNIKHDIQLLCFA